MRHPVASSRSYTWYSVAACCLSGVAISCSNSGGPPPDAASGQPAGQPVSTSSKETADLGNSSTVQASADAAAARASEKLVVHAPVQHMTKPPPTSFFDKFQAGGCVLRGKVASVKFADHPGKTTLVAKGATTGKEQAITLDVVVRTAELTIDVQAYHGAPAKGSYVPVSLQAPLVDFECPHFVDPATSKAIAAIEKAADVDGWHMRACGWTLGNIDVSQQVLALNPLPQVGQSAYFLADLPSVNASNALPYSATILAVDGGKVWFMQWAEKNVSSNGIASYKAVAPYGMALAAFVAGLGQSLGPEQAAPSPIPSPDTPKPK